MRIRYHQETKTDGIIVLESDPQLRTIYHYSQVSKTIRLPFPYLYHIISYKKINNIYVYGGLYDRGLLVFLRNSPLRTMKEYLYYSPTDIQSQGLVCTNHAFDHTNYKTLKELIHTVLGLWWGAQHNLNVVSYSPTGKLYKLDNPKEWSKKSIEDVLKTKWHKANSLKDILDQNQSIRYYRSFKLELQKLVKIDLNG